MSGLTRDARTVPAAFDAGINFFLLTADMHWPVYEPTRRGLADLLRRGGGIRDDIVVAAVSYVAQPEFCHLPFREVLDAIPALGRLDVTLAGAVGAHDFRRAREVLQARERARDPRLRRDIPRSLLRGSGAQCPNGGHRLRQVQPVAPGGSKKRSSSNQRSSTSARL